MKNFLLILIFCFLSFVLHAQQGGKQKDDIDSDIPLGKNKLTKPTPPIADLSKKSLSNFVETLQEPWIGTVSKVEGEVIIQRFKKNGTSLKESFAAKEFHLIQLYDEINVKKTGYIEIVLTNKNKLRLAPNSIFQIRQHIVAMNKQTSNFILLMGAIRTSVKKLITGSDYKMYIPNGVIGVRGTEFTASYSEEKQETLILCHSGVVSVAKKTDNNYDSVLLDRGEYTSVYQTYKDSSVKETLVDKPKNTTRLINAKITRSFRPNAATREEDPWAFSEVSTSLLRFGFGFEYLTFSDFSSNNISASYNPLFLMFESFYFEPYIGMFVSVPSINNTIGVRTGVKFNAYIYKGFYAGLGPDFMWLNTDINNYSFGLSFATGYTFNQRIWKVIDGIKFTYTYNSLDTNLKTHAVNFGLVFGFGDSGRERW